jgi:hypothetical protein
MDSTSATSSIHSSSESVCQRVTAAPAAAAALRIVCLQEPIGFRESNSADTIVVGFVGGFVKPTAEGQSQHHIERKIISGALRSAEGKLTGRGDAAEMLGLKRNTLQRKMQQLGIERADYASSGTRRSSLPNRYLREMFPILVAAVLRDIRVHGRRKSVNALIDLVRSWFASLAPQTYSTTAVLVHDSHLPGENRYEVANTRRYIFGSLA